jgi:hypothetical protein
MTLLRSLVILSVICSGVANGFGRVASAAVVLILPVLIYPMVGHLLKSSVMVVMIRFSDDLIALLSPATL